MTNLTALAVTVLNYALYPFFWLYNRWIWSHWHNDN